MGHGNALSQLQPPQVRTLREGFQILDRDSDGVVNREDVADMLNQLGMSTYRTWYALPDAILICSSFGRTPIDCNRHCSILPTIGSADYPSGSISQHHCDESSCALTKF